LETKVGAHFEKRGALPTIARRQSEIEEKLDLTKNQAPSQVEETVETENFREPHTQESPPTRRPARCSSHLNPRRSEGMSLCMSCTKEVAMSCSVLPRHEYASNS
jgi:hypothetical protein